MNTHLLVCCRNDMTVTAIDQQGNQAGVGTFTYYDPNPPEIEGCEDLTLVLPQGANGMPVDYEVTAMDQCDGPLPVTYKC